MPEMKSAPTAIEAPKKRPSNPPILTHPLPCEQDTLGFAMSRLMLGWQPEALHYLRRLRSTGEWAVLRVYAGQRTWTPVRSRGAGVDLILKMGGAI